MQKHVHHGQRPGAAVDLLPVEREVVAAYLLAGLDEQRTRPAGGVADAGSRLALGEPGQQGRHLGRREELARLLARLAGKGGDEVHVGIAYDVVVLEVRLVQRELAEIGEQIFQPGILLLGLAQIGRIETDVAEDAAAVFAAHLLAVGILEVGQRHVDELANVVGRAVLVEVVERTGLGHHEALVTHGTGRPLPVALVALQIFGILGFVDIADILQEEHRQHIILILAGVDDASKGIAGFPDYPIDLRLACFRLNLHDDRFYLILFINSCCMRVSRFSMSCSCNSRARRERRASSTMRCCCSSGGTGTTRFSTAGL